MHPYDFTRQMMVFQKYGMDHLTKTFTRIQDQAQIFTTTLVESPHLPISDSGKAHLYRWMRIYKRSGDDLKEAMDRQWDHMTTLIAPKDS